MKKMTISGTHESDPWEFIKSAMGGSGLTKDGIYYFRTCCEEQPAIVQLFQPFMDANLKGSSILIGTASLDLDKTVDEDSPCDSKQSGKRKRDKGLDVLVANSTTMVGLLQQSSAEAARKTDIMAQIEIAKALGDHDSLKALLNELNNKK